MKSTGDPDFSKVRRIFEGAIELSGAARDSYLDRECGDDLALRSAVLQLIAADERAATARLDDAVAPAKDAFLSDLDDPLGGSAERIGGLFEIERRLASGGMGVVYLARQHSPNRTIALKVLKPAYSTASAIRRFTVESEILARLEHPGIAQVFASGVHDLTSGTIRLALPWYAMEYLEGATNLLDHAQACALSLNARLELFARVCDAVHHAHRLGVIHRDLKPGNILVTKEGAPKIIDFGIARAIAPGHEKETMHTSPGELVGTLRYMAPEQLDADPTRIDVRTDVYALGIVLYELLVGSPPHDVKSLSLTDAARILREEEVERPSRRRRELRGEPEWIVLRALEKEPDRRYASAKEFADDVRRFLNHEPLLAGPPSIVYRTRKLVRRHRLAVAIGTLLFASLVGWSISTRIALARTERAEAAATRGLSKSQHTVEFMTALVQGLGERGSASATEIDRALDHSAGMIDRMFHDDPDVASALHDTLATLLRRRGRFDDAAKEIRLGIDLLEKAGLGDTDDAQILRSTLSDTLRSGGNDKDSKAAVADEPSSDAIENETITIQLAYSKAVVDLFDGRFASAEPKLRALYERASALEAEPCLISLVENAYSITLRELDRLDESEKYARESCRLERISHGERHQHPLNSDHNLAIVLLAEGRLDESRDLLEKTLAVQKEVLGADNARTLVTQFSLGKVLRVLGKKDEAARIVEATLGKQTETLGEKHPDRLKTVALAAVLDREQGRPEAAEQRLREALAVSAEAQPEGSFGRAILHAEHARCLVALNRALEAEAEFLAAIATMDSTCGKDHARRREVAKDLVALYESLGRKDDAAHYR